MNQAKNAGSKRESDMSIHAYVIMLHLTSQGYSNFIEMRKVLCRNTAGSYYIVLLAYIVKKNRGT